jgi:hypothetical protein
MDEAIHGSEEKVSVVVARFWEVCCFAGGLRISFQACGVVSLLCKGQVVSLTSNVQQQESQRN